MLADGIADISGGKAVVMVAIILWVSAVASAFVDNIPFAATMVPVIQAMAQTQGVDLHVLAWALSMGTDLGGSATPIGASANITGIGILRREGYTVKNSDFFQIGIPFTLAAIIPAYIYLWLVYGI